MIRAIEKLNPLSSFRVLDNQINLPPLFSIFLTLYNTDPVLKEEQVYDDKKDYMYSIAWEIDFSNSPILSIDGDESISFFNPDQIVKKNNLPADWREHQLVGIGGSYASQFYIGNGKNNSDLFYIDRDYEGKYKEIADNIYDFFSKLYLKKSQLYLSSLGLNEDDLYKNWKEDFYRVHSKDK